HLLGINALHPADKSRDLPSLFDLPAQGHFLKFPVALPGAGKIKADATPTLCSQSSRKLDEQPLAFHPVSRKAVVQNHRGMGRIAGAMHRPPQDHLPDPKLHRIFPLPILVHDGPPFSYHPPIIDTRHKGIRTGLVSRSGDYLRKTTAPPFRLWKL